MVVLTVPTVGLWVLSDQAQPPRMIWKVIMLVLTVRAFFRNLKLYLSVIISGGWPAIVAGLT